MAASFENGRYYWRLLSLALAMLLPSLGTSIANVALPSLEPAFAVSFSEVQWVVLSYLLAVTTLIVGVGRLGDMVGRRRLLLAGMGIFVIGSAVAALAPTIWVLVAARAVQGLGAAIMMALTVASVGDVVPKESAGSAMGLLGTVSAIGTALGPSLGGGLLSITGWPAVFAMLAGFGAVTFLIGVRMLPSGPAVVSKAPSFDLPGMLLLALSLGAYALSTTLGGAHPGRLNAGLLVLAVVGVGTFVVVERRTALPLVRLELLKDRNLSAGLVSLALVSTIMMATLVVGPFYLSTVLGLGPAATGLVMSIGPGVAALVGVPAGRLVDAYGSARMMIAGLIGVVFGAVSMTVLPGWFGTGGYIGGLSTITAGYALFQAANNTAIMADAPQDRRGLTSSLLGLARNLGLITGASAMGAVFAVGSTGVAALGLGAGIHTGLRVTFGVAGGLAGFALGIVLWAFAGNFGGNSPAPDDI
jgi:MFS family permease